MITQVVHQTEIQPGKTVSLECHFEGSPAPVVTWQRNNYDMTKTETVSYIGKVRYSPLIYARNSLTI